MSEDKMPEQRPNVFPTQDMINAANQTGEEIANQFAQENNLKPQVSDAEQKAAEEMARRTQEQIAERNRLMQEQIEKARQLEEQRREVMSQTPPQQQPPVQPPVPPTPPTPPSGDSPSGGNQQPQPQEVDKLKAISEPQYDAAFDVIPLPSEGKIYKNKKKSIKVAYLTAADENILSNPNLMESGEFLEVLINRKVLEPDMRYKDLHVGDRNAIMIWLRATGYGEMYPILVYDEKDEVFETEINLSTLKQIKLNVEPDSEGLFAFELPLSKALIKFKILTVGELEKLDEIIQANKDNPVNEEATLVLESQIVDVNGNRDRAYIKDFVRNMRVGDAQKLREYFNTIECGVDMNISVRTPGGGSVNTFLPFTPKFFWPNAEL